MKTNTKANEKQERALLVGCRLPDQPRWDSDDLMQELVRLSDTAGAVPVQTIIQTIQRPDPAFFLGSGKVIELAELCDQLTVDVMIFNDDLSPVQQKNLEEKLKVKVIDRTALILDIFAQRALTREGKLQVELAQLHYLLPRLTRMWTHLSRLGGGVGTRGPGETQLETDRRRIKSRIARIEKDLVQVSKHRLQHRLSRQDVPLPVIALLGYTNSGKSTLFQQMTGAKAFIEDKLFATLDPLVRHFILPNQQKVLLLDTVGFIRELPTQLVAAFKATLEEIWSADLLLHVIDISHPLARQHIDTVEKILKDMKASHIPLIKVFNKIDLLPEQNCPSLEPDLSQREIHISALKATGLDNLQQLILDVLQSQRETLHISLPYHNQEAINFMHRHGRIIESKYHETGLEAVVELERSKAAKLSSLLAGNSNRVPPTRDT